MSETKDDPTARKGGDLVPAAAPSARFSLLTVLLSVVLAGAAAAGGAIYMAKVSARSRGAAPAHGSVAVAASTAPPGFTLQLEPFVLMCADTQHAFHAMRTTLALEFDTSAKEEDIRPFVARIRDTALTLLRTIAFEVISDPAQMDRVRHDLQARFVGTGVRGLSRVLITDLVVQ